ncbi:MAG: V-type ATP synthase subunit F [Candidatus Diapherotrites archaeon]
MADEQKSFGAVAVIGDEAMCTGFKMAGIEKCFELEGAQAENKLREFVEGKNANIVIVDEKILFDADWRLRKRIEISARPVVVAIPGKRGPVKEKEAASLRELVKRALGFDLMKEGKKA